MTQEGKPRGFDRAKQKAEKLLKDGKKLNDLLGSAAAKSKRRKNQLQSVWTEVQTLLRLISAWWKKEYTDVPWKTIVYIAAALLYFVNPIDAIPDFIPISGLLDDITILTFVLRSVQKDLEKFRQWEELKTAKGD